MIGFHRVLIGTATVFFLMLAVLEGILWFTRQGGLTALLLAAGAGVAAVLLSYYFFHLERFLGRAVMHEPPGRGEAR